MTHTQADENSGALRGGFLRMKAQQRRIGREVPSRLCASRQNNTQKDYVFTFAGGVMGKRSSRHSCVALTLSNMRRYRVP